MKNLEAALDALALLQGRTRGRAEELKAELDRECELSEELTREGQRLLTLYPKELEAEVARRAASLSALREREAEVDRRSREITASEEQLRASLDHHAEKLEGFRKDEARLEVRSAELAEAERAAQNALRSYDKTRTEILADVTEEVREQEVERADAAIAAADARRAEQAEAEQASVAKAIAKAEGARVSELQGLANRMASQLVDLDPGLDVLVDYLTVTNQLKGKSRRKDCTDAQIAKIRKAHSL